MKKDIAISEEVRVYEWNGKFHNYISRLDSASRLLSTFSPLKYEYVIGEEYFDYQKNVIWTNISTIIKDENGRVLDRIPMDREIRKKILLSETVEELCKIVEEFLKEEEPKMRW